MGWRVVHGAATGAVAAGVTVTVAAPGEPAGVDGGGRGCRALTPGTLHGRSLPAAGREHETENEDEQKNPLHTGCHGVREE